MKGGIESGFKDSAANEFKPKLFHIKGNKQRLYVNEVLLNSSSMNSGDSFVLDGGTEIYVWEGEGSSKSEKLRAALVAQNIKSNRKSAEVFIEEEGKETEGFWKKLGGKGKIKSAEEGGDDMLAQAAEIHKLYRLSDSSGKLEFTKISEGKILKVDFKTEDVFIADVGDLVIVWIGKQTTDNEKKTAMGYGRKYLELNNRPDWLPIVKMNEGNEPITFSQYVN